MIMTSNKHTIAKTHIENISLHPQGHPLTNDLTGKAVRLAYCSGHILEQHWQADSRVLWKGVSGPLAGYDQTEAYRAFEIAKDIYLITWIEASTAASSSAPQANGPWLTNVILDFNKMQATASWMGPTNAGGTEHVLDQATMSYVECDLRY